MSEQGLIDLTLAQDFVFGSLALRTPQPVPLADLLGCVMAEELTAREAVPGFTNSSMDGFALRASDTTSGSTTLTIVGSVLAGDGSSQQMHDGEAIRIMTGAPLPDGADCVCMIEQVRVDPSSPTDRRAPVRSCTRSPHRRVTVRRS